MQYLLRECLIKWHTKNQIWEYKEFKMAVFADHLLIFVGQTLFFLETAMSRRASLQNVFLQESENDSHQVSFHKCSQ